MTFVRAMPWTLASLILAGLAWQLWRSDFSFIGSLRQPSAMLIASASILAIASYFAFVDAWAALRGKGEKWRDVGGIWFASLLARYVPGAVWQGGVRIAGAHAAGESKRLVLLQYGAEQLLACFSAATLALVVIGIMHLEMDRSVVLGLSLVAVGSAGIVLAAGRRGIAAGWTTRAVMATLVGHAAMALAFAAFVMSWTQVDLRVGATSMAAFLVAGVAGILAVFVPAGLGVREAALSLLLAPQLGEGPAIGLALASRVWLLLSELGAFGVWIVLARNRAVSPAHASRRSVDRFGGLDDPEGRRLRARRIVSAFKSLDGLDIARARVLDVGCSAGLITQELATVAALVIGVDVDAEALETARGSAGSAHFVLASGERLPFADESFDAVVCNHVYEHVPSAPALMIEIHRVLRPQGACYLAAGHTLQLVEPHYRLPLLSMMPRRWAGACLRMAGRANSYDERFLPPWRLRSLGQGYTSMRLVSPQMLAAPDQFGFPRVAALPSPARRLLAVASGIAARLAPTWIFLLRK